MEARQELGAFRLRKGDEPRMRAAGFVEPLEEDVRSVQARQCVEDVAVGIENVVDAVAGDGALDPASVTEVDRDTRRRPHALPVKDPVFPQASGDGAVRVEDRTEEPAVRTGELFVEPPEES